MQLIPVIDLKDGHVVHAIRGNRSSYQPIHHQSGLTKSSDIQNVVEAFLQLYAFKTFYIADINAICGSGDHQRIISTILNTYRDIDFWIDSGSQFENEILSQPNRIQVVGTESQRNIPVQTGQNFVLSLDYKDDVLDDPAGWFEHIAIWPDTIIAMTLKRVGSNNGPDLDTLSQLIDRCPNKRLIAAGGIRNVTDLTALKAMGVSGVLLATALHNGRINRFDLEKY